MQVTYPIEEFWLKKVLAAFTVDLLDGRHYSEVEGIFRFDYEVSQFLRGKLPALDVDSIKGLASKIFIFRFSVGILRVFRNLIKSALHFCSSIFTYIKTITENKTRLN